MIKGQFELNNAIITLQERVSKGGKTYKACVLTANGIDYILGFEKVYFTLRKIYKNNLSKGGNE